MKRKVSIVVLLLVVFFLAIVNSAEVFAKAEGWIGTNTEAAAGTSGGGDCSGDAAFYRPDCAGASWIYYKANSGISSDKDKSIRFAPYYNANAYQTTLDVTIPATCFNDGNGGFWHYGFNSTSKTQLTWDGKFWYNYFRGASTQAETQSMLSYYYTDASNRTGHWSTYGYGLYSWIPERTLSNSTLSHQLISSSKETLYEASKYGASKDVLNDFKIAYKTVNGTDYTGDNLPKGTFAFCFWDDMDEKYKITAKAVDMSGNSLSSVIKDREREATVGKKASVERRLKDGYTFVCWKTSATGSCYTATSGDPYVSGTKKEQINKTMTEDYTVYAAYAPNYALSITKDSYSTASVTRESSPYGDGATGALSNGAVLYYGDKLKIELGGSACHPASSGTYTINGGTKTAGTYNVTVSNDVAVAATSPLSKYTLTISRADGSTIEVKRNTVAPGAPKGTSVGNLSNGAAIYCGDKLSAAFGLNTGYEWGSHSFVGSGINDTTSLNIDSHTVGADVIVTTANVKLKNFTLSAYAFEINSSGNFVKDLNDGNTFDSGNADYNGTATVSSSNYKPKPEGYTFRGWRKNKSSGNLNTSSQYSVNNITQNEKVYAAYERNAFEGRLRVFEGDSTSGTNSKSTGFVSSNTSLDTLEIPCGNSGCTATFDLALKTTAGSGKTGYDVKRKASISSMNWGNSLTIVTPASPFAPSTSGSTININGGQSHTVSLKPNEEYCYRLAFSPYGSEADTKLTTLVGCVKAKETVFEGKTSVIQSGGSQLATTDWQKTTMKTRHVLSGCSPVDGCKIKFTHSLRASSSNGGSTTYNISRDSNDVSTSSPRRISNGAMASGSFSGTESQVRESEELTVYPGMVICEKMEFPPKNSATTKVYTSVCVSVVGDAQPADPEIPNGLDDPDNPTFPTDTNGDSENGTYLNIEVKNNDGIDRYKTYQKVVYAKPNDKLTFRTTYNPVLQYTYHLIPNGMRLNNGGVISNSGSVLGIMFTARMSARFGWKNNFEVKSNQYTTAFSQNYPWDIGDITPQIVSNDHIVAIGEVGRKEMYETAITNDSQKTTPAQVTFTDESEKMVATVYTASKNDKAYVRVPYNFNTSVKMASSDDVVVYAGEDASSIKYEAGILKKTNSLTTDGTEGSAYATIARDVKVKIISFVSGDDAVRTGTDAYGSSVTDLCDYYGDVTNCDVIDDTKNSGTYNSEGLSSGKVDEYSIASGKLYAPDVAAGSNYCVAAAIYPSSSGADYNLNSSGSGQWRISDSRCFKVAKKPSFQLWGGGIFMNGGAKVPESKKRNLDGYATASDKKTYVFGSWVETNLVANGTVTGLASGAGAGYTANDGGSLIANPGGSKEDASPNYCNRSMLSVSNTACTDAVGSAAIKTAINDKAALVNKLFPGMEVNTTSDAVNLESDYTEAKARVRYTYSNNNLTINAATISKGITHVVRSNGNILISGNLIYEDSYNVIGQIPKLIIYAKNIKVNCDVNNAVTRIDAVLIADENMNTCSENDGDKGEYNDINSKAYSNQLTINGMIIANNLTLNRTYGAARGANTIVPAEIVNYDTSLYLWSFGGDDDSGGNGKYSQTYIRELPPRY